MIAWVMRYRKGRGFIDEGELPDTPDSYRDAEDRVRDFLQNVYHVSRGDIEDVAVEVEARIHFVTVFLKPKLEGRNTRAKRKEEADG